MGERKRKNESATLPASGREEEKKGDRVSPCGGGSGVAGRHAKIIRSRRRRRRLKRFRVSDSSGFARLDFFVIPVDARTRSPLSRNSSPRRNYLNRVPRLHGFTPSPSPAPLHRRLRSIDPTYLGADCYTGSRRWRAETSDENPLGQGCLRRR